MFSSKSMALKARQAGQSSAEYIVVTTFAVLVLIEGGSSAPVTEVVTAMKNAYRGFVYAISYATTLMAL
jgi:hypothetical protein